MTRIFIITLGLWSLQLSLFSQKLTVSGESPNYYLKVDEVLTNSVRITQTLTGQIGNFIPGDKVLIIQMTGVTIDSNVANFKTKIPITRGGIGNTGKFEILQIDEVNTSGVDTLIYFTDNLTNSYDNVEKIQLVRVIEGETITVNGTLTAKPWDGRVGGIIAILGIDTIKFDPGSRIDASGKGFRGALSPVEIYPEGLCRNGLSATVNDTLYFLPNQLYRSGNKGEGIITVKWPFTKGTAYNFNGGGAGNGLFSGGGGGSNYMAGGDGGQQNPVCTGLYPPKGGWGGLSNWEFYFIPELPKAIFGGGGGTGNQKSGSTPSNGGNGGGMVFLITGTVVTGSNVILRSNGSNAWPATTTGSGAGGGAGGTILMDASEYTGQPFTVEIKGGNGSSTTTPVPYVNGAGGGGSGGVFWHSGSESPEITLVFLNGSGGITPGGSGNPLQLGRPGQQGLSLQDLIVPLTGFLFNSIRGTDTICESQIPNILTASQPKGGDGNYTFEWQQSTDSINWEAAAGDNDLRSLTPVALNQTTYYRRIVQSVNPVTFGAIYDTSRAVKIFVYPSIANNSILGTDTICYNSDGKVISGLPVTGGNNNYSYTWQETLDDVTWTVAGNLPDYDPSALTASTNYRRIVNSTPYCSDTSNQIRIAVLPSITDNSFTAPDTAVCEGSLPGRIIMNSPGGGDGMYSYQWQYSTTSGWTGIVNTTDSISYTSGIVNENTKFRRVVYSGYNDACIDTSEVKTVSVRPPVSNNFIGGSLIRYTCYNSPVSLTGSVPEDGFGTGTYSYAWEESDDNIVWQEVTGSNKDFISGNLTSAKYFRRIVYSTPLYHECISTSMPVEVRINPLPTGNLYSTSDTICAGSPVDVKFNVNGNAPFNVSVKGEIEPEKNLTGIIGNSGSIEFNPLITQEFIMVSVEDDSGCFADAAGFIPVIPVEVYEIPVANAGADAAVCGSVYTLSAQKTNDSFGGLWTASNAVFSDSTLENAITTSGLYGEQTFIWTETNWHCTDDDETIVTFYEQPQPAEAGSDQELDFSFTTQLQATAPSPGSGMWTVSGGSCEFDDVTLNNAQVSELDNETILRWTVVNGVCPAVSDSMKIIVKPLELKKAFTPDGNSLNDYFNIGALNAEQISARIFNRSGQLVFESDDYCKGDLITSGCDVWEGLNMNNVELPEGTYYYIVRMKIAGREKEFEMRSFVEIIR